MSRDTGDVNRRHSHVVRAGRPGNAAEWSGRSPGFALETT